MVDLIEMGTATAHIAFRPLLRDFAPIAVVVLGAWLTRYQQKAGSGIYSFSTSKLE